jgi:hypothetical protein
MSFSFKKLSLLTLSLGFLITNASFAVPTMPRPRSVRDVLKQKSAQMKSTTFNTKAFEANIINSMHNLSKQKAGVDILQEALSKTFSIKDDGIARDIKLQDLAKDLEVTKLTLEKLDRNKLTTEDIELVKQLERSLEIAPQFIALAAVTTKTTQRAGSTTEHVEAFAKELSLIHDILMTMKSEEVRSHLDVMAEAIKLKLEDKNLEGDQAFIKALQAKYGDKANDKIAELLKCIR